MYWVYGMKCFFFFFWGGGGGEGWVGGYGFMPAIVLSAKRRVFGIRAWGLGLRA